MSLSTCPSSRVTRKWTLIDSTVAFGVLTHPATSTKVIMQNLVARIMATHLHLRGGAMEIIINTSGTMFIVELSRMRMTAVHLIFLEMR